DVTLSHRDSQHLKRFEDYLNYGGRWYHSVARAYEAATTIAGWSVHNRNRAVACVNVLTKALETLEAADPERAQYLVRHHGLSKPELRDALGKLRRYLAELPENWSRYLDIRQAEIARLRKQSDYYALNRVNGANGAPFHKIRRRP